MMNANNLQTADYLDILFDGRNKDYGAYQLQRNYNKRLSTAVGIVLLLCLVVVVSGMLANNGRHAISGPVIQDSVILTQVDQTPAPVQPLIPPPHIRPVAQIQYTVPVIVQNTDATDNAMPPVDDVDNKVIGTMNVVGDPESGNAPPVETKGTGLAQAPFKIQMLEDTLFWKAEIPAEFPGDWKRFLERNLHYPEQAIENGTQGPVKLEFTVDKAGNISDIKALSDPGDGLAEEAIRIIRKCPQWRPAEQNGRKVIYRHTQTITFNLQN